MNPADDDAQSFWNACSSGSSSSERSRFSPCRNRGDNAVASSFAARTSNARPSMNAGTPTAASS